MGGRPVSSSNRTTPKLKMSLFVDNNSVLQYLHIVSVIEFTLQVVVHYATDHISHTKMVMITTKNV
jgi:hypothetical protein